MKQIEIPDKLFNDLRAFANKQDIPLKDYIEGVLETSMQFPDGIEIPESFTKAQKEQTGTKKFLQGMQFGRERGIVEGTKWAVSAIIKSDDFIFREMSRQLGTITTGSSNPKLNLSYNIGIGVGVNYLKNEFEQALKKAQIGSVASYDEKIRYSVPEGYHKLLPGEENADR